MVRAGTEEHQLFAVRKPMFAGLAPGTGAPRPLFFRERLPAWVPPRLKAPLEEFLRRFLGEGEPGQVPAWLLQLELSWPRAQGWAHAGLILHAVGILYGWWYGMGAQSAVAGWVTGAVYGVVLRTRAEQRFDWPAYGPALMLAVLLSTSLKGSGWVHTKSHAQLPLAVLQGLPGVGRLFHLAGLLHYPLLLALGLWWPFFKDIRSLRVGNDRLLYGQLALAVLYGSNPFLALGAWYGGLFKAVRERRPMHGAPPAAGAAGMVGAPSAAVPTMLQQQQQPQPQGLQRGFPAAAAGAIPSYAGGSPTRRPFQGPQLAAPMAPAPAAEAQLAAAAAALRYQQQAAAEASHPRRWLEEPEPALYDEYGSRGGGLASRRRSTGSGWQEAPGPVEEGPRYGLRSRGQRRASASMLPSAAAMAPMEAGDDGGDMMDLSDSPPPPPAAAAQALRAPGFYDGARRLSDGLGRYETLSPYY